MSQRESLSVRLDAVTKVYGHTTAVDAVSFEVPAGSFFALLGPSGSGKSTILQMIGGFLDLTGGGIWFGDRDLTEVAPNKRPCNTIFQDLGLFPHMMVADNIGYGLRLRNVPAAERAKRIAAILEVVDLAGYQSRRIHQLSGGQRQRVALARALVLEPAILLLDEPLSGLDERLRQQLRDELGQLHRRLGGTYLAVTHNQDEAFALADIMAVLRRGRVEQIGRPRDLFERPANSFVARFVGMEALLRPQSVERAGDGYIATIAGRRIPCRATSGLALDGPLLVGLRPERIRLVDGAAGADLGPVTVKGFVYRGRESEIEVALADGQSLRVVQPFDGGALAPEAGRQAHLSWSPHVALLVADEQDSFTVNTAA